MNHQSITGDLLLKTVLVLSGDPCRQQIQVCTRWPVFSEQKVLQSQT